MTNAIMRIERLRCVDPNASVTDEVKMQQDGRQVWPGTGDAFFSVSSGTEIAMDLVLPFHDVTRIILFDQEDVGTDDNLGFAEINKNEEGGVRTKDIMRPGSHYILTYRVKSLEF